MDVDAFVAEYHRDLFGPAAGQVAEYHQMWEDLFQNVPYDSDAERSFLRGVTPEFLSRCDALMDAADSAVRTCDRPADEKAMLALRLKKVRAGLRVARVESALMEMSADPALAVLAGPGESLSAVIAQMETDPDLIDVIQLPLAVQVHGEGELRIRAFQHIWEGTSLTGGQRRRLAAALREGRGADVARGLGYITDWNIVGPFEATGIGGLFISHPPEEGVDLSATYEGKLGPVSWRRITHRQPVRPTGFPRVSQ